MDPEARQGLDIALAELLGLLPAPFSSDGNAVRALIARMIERGYVFVVGGRADGYVAAFTRIGDTSPAGSGEADERPLAVAQAARQALRLRRGRRPSCRRRVGLLIAGGESAVPPE